MRLRSLTHSVLAGALTAVALPVAAQSAVSGLGASYGFARANLIAAAEQMPEEHYGFKPTPEVRSFGQLIGHVANANFMICAMASGSANPNATDFEKATAKSALVQGLKDSFVFCDAAYLMSDAKALEPVKLFGNETNRLGALAFNMGHDMEHYGNVVTYMRLKGQVPPSSQP